MRVTPQFEMQGMNLFFPMKNALSERLPTAVNINFNQR